MMENQVCEARQAGLGTGEESLLHFIWKTKNFNHRRLVTTSGQALDILDWGVHNRGAGPDFLHARIQSGHLTWAGHIEMHVRSSDWYRHHHHLDAAYDQVILHVVWEDDRPVTDMHLNPIPTLVLEPLVDVELLERVLDLLQGDGKLACQNHIGGLSPFLLNTWKERQLVERLEARTHALLVRLGELNGDWEQVAFETMARAMGFHANSDQMQVLAQDVGWPLVRKLMHDRTHLHALLFGRAGMLSDGMDGSWPNRLKSEYQWLRTKYELGKELPIRWDYKKSRPSNFPGLRLAQLAEIIHQSPSLIRPIIERNELDETLASFDVTLPEYWNDHYHFQKQSKKFNGGLSLSARRLLIINYVVPLMFSYGKKEKKSALTERSIRFLYALPVEINGVIKRFTDVGVAANSAAESQALLHTYRNYCAPGRCLECQVGAQILTQ